MSTLLVRETVIGNMIQTIHTLHVLQEIYASPSLKIKFIMEYSIMSMSILINFWHCYNFVIFHEGYISHIIYGQYFMKAIYHI